MRKGIKSYRYETMRDDDADFIAYQRMSAYLADDFRSIMATN